MKINYKKTKLMIFNPCKKIDFRPEISLGGQEIEVVNEIRLLGLTIRSDMRWCSNTKNMIIKANKRLWILRRLKNMGADINDLVDVYIKQVRCIVELAVPAWQGGLSQAEKQDLERQIEETENAIASLSKQKISLTTQLEDTKRLGDAEARDRASMLSKFKNLSTEVCIWF